VNRIIVAAATAALAGAAFLPTADSADGDGGFSCGIAGTGTVRRAQEGEALSFEGEITGGPYTVSQTQGQASATIKCTVMSVYGEVVYQVQSETSSSATLLGNPTQFEVRTDVNRDFLLCTEVSINRNGNVYPAYHDADHDPSNGVQCAKAHPKGDEVTYVYVEPPGTMGGGDRCVYVDHNQQFSELICAPGGPI
jgi:hypothetical protein